MTDISALVAFISARLAEDSGYAIGASRGRAHGGHGTGPNWTARSGSVEDAETGGTIVYDEGMPTSWQARHIAHHDPARVLREVEAKRKLLVHVEHLLTDDESDESAQWMLRLLAAPYSDHPDYRTEWRP